MQFYRAAMLAGMALGLLSGTASASYIVTFAQSGSGVTATGVGEFNTDYLTSFSLTNLQPGINPSNVYFGFSPSPVQEPFGTAYSGTFTGSGSYGTGGLSQPDIASGDTAAFLYNSQYIIVPTGYVAGSTLNSSMTFSGATFTTLGLSPGVYTYTYGPQDVSDIAFSARADVMPTDTIQIIVSRGISPVPLPASAPMFGAALMALGAVGYGMKRTAKTAA